MDNPAPDNPERIARRSAGAGGAQLPAVDVKIVAFFRAGLLP